MRSCILCVALLMAACGSRQQQGPTDTLTTGVIPIAADESFAPIVGQEIEAFENLYPEAGIVPIYTDEAEVLRLLAADSVRLAVATRKLSAAQHRELEKRQLVAHEIKIGTDAIALIVNPANSDTLLTVGNLRRIMSGEVHSWRELNPASKLGAIKLVFDNQHSSTVRYAVDSVCRGRALRSDAYAQGTNEQVIDYVASDPDALGVIGVSWVGDKADSTNLSFSEKVRVVALSTAAEATKYNSYKPYQAYLALGDYPLCRDVYVLMTDPREGLATGFTSFVCNDRGQRIIYRAGLVPATQMIRIVNVNNNF